MSELANKDFKWSIINMFKVKYNHVKCMHGRNLTWEMKAMGGKQH